MAESDSVWSDGEIIRLIQLIDQERSLEDIHSILHRDQAEIKTKAKELALVLPKEFETRFFFQSCK